MIWRKCKVQLEWDPADYCYTPTGWDYVIEEEPTCVDGRFHSEMDLTAPLSAYGYRVLTETDEGNEILLERR